VLSDQVPGNEPLLDEATRDGHEIANHLNTDVPSILFNPVEFESRLLQAEKIIEPYNPPGWFRPGSGWINEEMLTTLDRNGYQTVLGSIYPFDSQIPSTWFASQYILWRAKPGGIIVLHDRGDRGMRTVETLQVVLPELRSQGYRILNLSELADHRSNPDPTAFHHH
jgi:peptidoglycan/xylan/chitin deacetylase (PgdA/CDA1 family)